MAIISMGEKLKQYNYLTIKAKQLKANLKALKVDIVSKHFGDLDVDAEGTFNASHDDILIKTVAKLNRKVVLDDSDIQMLVVTLGAEKFKAVFKPQFKLSLTEYRKLDDKTKALVDTFVVATPAEKTLEIEGDFS